MQSPSESRKRCSGGAQFSIDELLRQDDKKSRFDTDSKSVSVDEVDDNEEDIDVSCHDEENDSKIKREQKSPETEN